MAALGFRVLVASRSPPPADLAAEHLRVDLAKFRDVDALAARFAEVSDRLDLLVLNAGVGLEMGDVKTEDGLPAMMQINYLSQVRLLRDKRIQERLAASPLNRVVLVTSGAQASVFDIESAKRPLNLLAGDGQRLDMYSHSKFLQVAYAKYLAKQGIQFASSGESLFPYCLSSLCNV